MSTDINNFIRRTGSFDRKAIDKIIEELANANPPVEDEGGQGVGFISLMAELRVRTTSVATNDGDFKLAETRTREGNSIFRSFPKSPAAYPLTHTKVGTISIPQASMKYGGRGKFEKGYIKIDDHAQIENSKEIALILWFKADQRHGILPLFCKKDISSATNAGLEIYLDGNPERDYAPSNYASANYNTTTSNEKVVVSVADGTTEKKIDQAIANILDGNWHSLVLISSAGDYADVNYANSNYAVIATNTLQVYIDKVSIGSVDITSLGSIVNSRAAYIGGRDNAGTIQDQLEASLAHLYYRETAFTTTEINDYHDSRFINTKGEKTSIPFIENADELENAALV